VQSSSSSSSESGGRRRRGDVRRPLFGEAKSPRMSTTGRNSWSVVSPWPVVTASCSAVSPSPSAVLWNFEDRHGRDFRPSVARSQHDLGSVRRWPSVKPLDLSVTSRSAVVTSRDDVTAVGCGDWRRRLCDGQQHSAARYVD